MSNLPFFTLTAEETHPLCLMVVAMTDGIFQRGEIKKPEGILHGEFLEAFERLKKKLYTMKSEKDENGEYTGQEIGLDVHESFALIYCIVTIFYRLKAHVKVPPEKRTDITPEEGARADLMYYELKDDAADLLERLTIAWQYFNYGLQTLEEVFDRKIAVRPLKVDDEIEITEINNNEQNKRLFAFMYQWLDAIEIFQDKYKIAQRLYTCQYIHLLDYKALKAKLLAKNEKKKINLTLRDNITLYCSLNLLGLFFVSNAARYYEEIGSEADANRPVSPPSQKIKDYFDREGDKAAKAYEDLGLNVDANGTVHTSFTDIRRLFLKYNDQLLVEIRNNIKKLPAENKIFTKHIECVKKWKV